MSIVLKKFPYILIILYGNSDFACDVNCSLFVAVHRYILDT